MAEALQPLGRGGGSDGAHASPRRADLLRHLPAVTLALFLAPVAAGLIGTWLPSVGYFPSLGATALTLEPWAKLWSHPSLEASLGLTLRSGVLSTAVAFLLVVAFVAGCHGTALFRSIRRLLAPLLAVPHAAVAIGLAFLIAPSGWLVRLASPWATGWQIPPDLPLVQDPYGLALAAGLVLKETPFLLLMTIAALGQTQADQRLAIARSLGYGPVKAWLTAVLPTVYGQIRLPLFAVLAYGLSVVDMAMILASASPPTLAVLVFRWFNDPDLSMRFVAAAGATLQLGIVIAAIGLCYALERAAALLGRYWIRSGRRGGSGRPTRLMAGLAMSIVFAAALLSVFGMALWSLARRWRYPDTLPTSWTLDTWMRQLDGLAWSTVTTLVLGLAAALLALLLAIGCLENERRRGLHLSDRGLWLLYLPLLVPQVAFLFGNQILAVRLGLDGTWPALVWSHLLFVLPYVFLALADPYRALDDRYLRTGLCLGASRNRVLLTVTLPMLLRPILVALAIGFAVSVAQYLPTMFAGGGRFVTLTTEAVGLAGGADRRVLGVYTFLQAMLPLLAFAAALGLPAWLHRNRKALRGPA